MKNTDVIDSDGTMSGYLNRTSSNLVAEKLNSANSVKSQPIVNLGDSLDKPIAQESEIIRNGIVYFGIGLIC